MRVPVYRLRGRLGDYAIGALIGLAAAAFYTGTMPALIAAAVLILTAAAIFAAQAIWAVHINRIFREELGDDPDPFNTRLRLEGRYQPTDTDTGETR